MTKDETKRMKENKMKVHLTTPKEVEMFQKLVAGMNTCHKCGHIQPIQDIPTDVYCLSTEFKYGYVEVQCPKCGDVQVVLPIYIDFPSCVEEFDVKAKQSGVDPNTDPIPSKIHPKAVEALRRRIHGKGVSESAKEKYKGLF